MISRIPPQDLDAEMAVLGGIMLDNSMIDICTGILGVSDFYKQSHRTIYKAILEIYNNGNNVDIVNLMSNLTESNELERIGSVAYLIGLMDNVPVAAYVKQYANTVKARSVQRGLIMTAQEAMQKAYDLEAPGAIIDGLEDNLKTLARSNNKDSFSNVADYLDETTQQIEQIINGERINGVKTGFYDFDSMTGGLKKGGLYVLAARPSQGKTALAMQIAENVAANGANVLVQSLEMAAPELLKRMVSASSKINLQRDKYNDNDVKALKEALDILGNIKLFINDRASKTVNEIISSAKDFKRVHGDVGLIVIDYLQLIESTGTENRTQEVSKISRKLKLLARDLDTPVLVLSQLSRGVESRTNKRPVLSDLRDSGAIEQDADLVAFIYRDEYYNPSPENAGLAEIIISKQRNGPVGTVKMFFIADHVRFVTLAKN